MRFLLLRTPSWVSVTSCAINATEMSASPTPMISSTIVKMRPFASSGRTSLNPTVVRVMTVMYTASRNDQSSSTQ